MKPCIFGDFWPVEYEKNYLLNISNLGGIVSYLKSDGKFKPVSQIIMYEMEEIHREQLAQSVQTILNEVDATDLMQMMVIIKGNEVLKTRILSEVTNFIQTQLQLSILWKKYRL